VGSEAPPLMGTVRVTMPAMTGNASRARLSGLAIVLCVGVLSACGESTFEYADDPDASTGGAAGGGVGGLGGVAGAVTGGSSGSAGASSGGSAGTGGGAGTGAAYPTAVKASGPAAYWRFEETGGQSVADEIGPGITGTLVGLDGGGAASLGEPGAFAGSRALKLAGPAAVDFGDQFDFAAQAPFTLEALVRLDSYPTSANANLLTKYGGGNGWRTELEPTKGIGLILYVSGNATAHFAPTLKVVEKEWTYLAFTFSGTELCDFLGNPPLALQSECKVGSKSLPATGAALRLGGGLNAWVDEVAIYNGALSKLELDAHYAAAVADGMQ